MPRTLPAALTTVMDAGIYEPYLRIVISEESDETNNSITLQPIAYKLEALKAEVTVENIAITSVDPAYFRIVRGAIINGSPVTISSIQFKINTVIVNGRFVTIFGEMLTRNKLTIAANATYQDVIEETLADGPQAIVPSYEGTAAWKSYKFYPAGRNIILNPRKKLFPILQQKYLIFATEDGFDGTNNNAFFFVASEARATDYNFTDPLFNISIHRENRLQLWRDENNTVHTNGFSNYIIHNLGYLESTASNPDGVSNSNIGSYSSKLPVHLKYRTGDQAHTDASDINNYTGRIEVIEVFDQKSTPSWYMIIKQIEWYSNTEGGALPSTIEAAAPYTPLATGTFDRILSDNDNNLQAAMETLDDHTHSADYQPLDSDLTAIAALAPANDDILQRKSGAWTNQTLAQLITDLTEQIQDLIGAMVSGNTETGIAVSYDDTNGKLDFSAALTETDTNDIFAVSSPGGVSAFAGTIATLPGGATLTYNVTSGQEGAMVPTSTSQLAKMRLYNTTRGTSALISNCVTGTNTLTLTANLPAGWQVGDTITIASQTVSGGGLSWIDLEITSGPTGKSAMFINFQINSGTAGDNIRTHPFEASFSASKYTPPTRVQVAGAINDGFGMQKIVSNVFSLAWTGTPTSVAVREAGYIP